jgi:hypothetical protein
MIASTLAPRCEAEQRSGVDYEDARREHDDAVDPAGYRGYGGAIDARESSSGQNYQRYQQAAQQIRNVKDLDVGDGIVLANAICWVALTLEVYLGRMGTWQR